MLENNELTLNIHTIHQSCGERNGLDIYAAASWLAQLFKNPLAGFAAASPLSSRTMKKAQTLFKLPRPRESRWLSIGDGSAEE